MLVLLIASLQAFQIQAADTVVKGERITLNFEGTTLKEAFEIIENKTPYNFFYNHRAVDVFKKINVRLSDVPIEVAIQALLKDANVSWRIKGSQIVLKKTREPGLLNAKEEKPEENDGSMLTVPTITYSYLTYDVTVSGRVVDDEGLPLPGVNVIIKGTTIGTTTDAEGRYTIDVAGEDATLVFSFIGFTTQEVVVGNRTTIDITLVSDVVSLEEVVVVGYGTEQKKDLTSAVTTISNKQLLQGAFNSPLQMIDGKVAGVTISNPAAGDPNRGTDIQVRGAASIDAGNGPLIIIDGMPGGDLRNVAQQDIESITVLKDGSAAAIYGSRGANGVILITTKKGTPGRVTVNYDSYFDHDEVAAKPDILSAEEFIANNRDTDRGARTNWYDELIRTNNFGQNHSVAIGGGSENTVFRISGNYREKSGIDIASDRREYGIRANFQQKALNGFLEFGGNLSHRVANEEYTNYGVFQQAVKLNPTLPVWDPDDPSRFAPMFGFDVYNPVQNLLTRENGADQEYSIADFNIQLNLLKNLNTQVKLARQGHDMYRREYHTSQAKESIDNNRTGRARLQNEKWTDWTFEWTGNYNTTIADNHDIKLLGGYSYQEFNNAGFWAENSDFPSDAFTYNNLDAGLWNRVEGRLGMDSWRSREKVIAFFGRANYNFNDTYLVMGSLRYEGNTKFGTNNKWGLFPAAAVAWRLSNLEAIRNISVIDDLKLRLSYGVNGRSGFPRYSSLSRYTGYGRWQNDEGEWIQVYGPANNPNPELRWEKQKSYNLGLDFGLFGSRVTGTFDAFIRRSEDVITNYDAPVPPYLHSQIFTNVATTSARGLELALNWIAVDKTDFKYTTNLTAFYVKSRLDKFSNGTFTKGFMERYWLPSPGNPGYAQRLEDGSEIGSFYGYRYAGVDESGNIMIWKDAQAGGDRILATEGSSTDKTYLGHGAPHYELAWGNTLNWKGFDLNLYFRGRFDYQILNLYQMYYGLVAEPGVNLLRDAYERNAHIRSGKVITDYFLESGDFFKLDNITLGWSPGLNTNWLTSFRIYATVRNAFTVTSYTGLDPTTVNITGLEPGIGDLNVYPVVRSYSLGIQANF
ncbi:MAG TPA: SusC/RagA family TonB-linked outer membrane protein [Chryseosolibacter sp.]|nr:SusC/RagA family TonB-linked outer membrane protein [Chryseosolibacter sp.]